MKVMEEMLKYTKIEYNRIEERGYKFLLCH
jgi:hypothetical protein